jgi:hypothetical protein
MKQTVRLAALCCVLCSLVAAVGMGCGSQDSHPPTPAELKAFKGGPMPPEARAALAAMRAHARFPNGAPPQGGTTR